jgi:hypothetical protein
MPIQETRYTNFILYNCFATRQDDLIKNQKIAKQESLLTQHKIHTNGGKTSYI